MDPARLRRPSAGPIRGPLLPSLALLVLVLLFCTTTHWGRTYFTFVHRTWITWSEGRVLSGEERRRMLYDQTYPVLVYIREHTPPDAVILMPPEKFIAPGDDIPLLASPSSAYNFIYPRVPVHWGDPSPWKDRVNWVLVWHHWGLDLVDPGAAQTPENDTGLYPLPPGRRFSW